MQIGNTFLLSSVFKVWLHQRFADTASGSVLLSLNNMLIMHQAMYCYHLIIQFLRFILLQVLLISMQDLIDKFYRNPRRIFNLPEQPHTYVEVDMQEEWVLPDAMPYSKSRWTPFAGMKVRGAVHRVVVRGEVAYVDGQVSIYVVH